jgi:hypothetical protein
VPGVPKERNVARATEVVRSVLEQRGGNATLVELHQRAASAGLEWTVFEVCKENLRLRTVRNADGRLAWTQTETREAAS